MLLLLYFVSANAAFLFSHSSTEIIDKFRFESCLFIGSIASVKVSRVDWLPVSPRSARYPISEWQSSPWKLVSVACEHSMFLTSGRSVSLRNGSSDDRFDSIPGGQSGCEALRILANESLQRMVSRTCGLGVLTRSDKNSLISYLRPQTYNEGPLTAVLASALLHANKPNSLIEEISENCTLTQGGSVLTVIREDLVTFSLSCEGQSYLLREVGGSMNCEQLGNLNLAAFCLAAMDSTAEVIEENSDVCLLRSGDALLRVSLTDTHAELLCPVGRKPKNELLSSVVNRFLKRAPAFTQLCQMPCLALKDFALGGVSLARLCVV